MDETAAAALARGVRVGAHPGFPDRANFGRVAVEMTADAIENLVLYQVAALDGFVRSRGGALAHVKPHGALYHQAGEFPDVARAIAEGVRRFRSRPDPARRLRLDAARGRARRGASGGCRGLCRSPLPARRHARAAQRPDALLTDPDQAADQAVSLAWDHVAIAADGSRLAIAPDSICLHGDTPGAAAIARRVSERLREAGVRIAPFDAGEARQSEGVAIPIRVVG